MKFIEAKTNHEEKTVKLSELEAGSCFRFPETSYKEALEKPGQSFYIVIADIGAKETGRISVMSADMKSVGRRDSDRLVIPHEVTMMIKPAETVPVEMAIEDQSDKA